MIESVAPGVKAGQQTAGAPSAIFANTRTLASWETGRRIRVAAHAAFPRPAASVDDAAGFEGELAAAAGAWLEGYLRASPSELWLGSLFELVDADEALEVLTSSARAGLAGGDPRS